MKSEVHVTVTGEQRDPERPDGWAEVIRTEADGLYRFVAGRHHVVYEEDGIKTHLTAGGNRLEIRRSGAADVRMVIESGKSSTVHYGTAEGTIAFDLRGGDGEILESGGTVAVRAAYSLMSGDTVISCNRTEKKKKKKD